jgi:hypothetical protein
VSSALSLDAFTQALVTDAVNHGASPESAILAGALNVDAIAAWHATGNPVELYQGLFFQECAAADLDQSAFNARLH